MSYSQRELADNTHWFTDQDLRIIRCKENGRSSLEDYFHKRVAREVEGRWCDRERHERLCKYPSPAMAIAKRYTKLLFKRHRPEFYS